MQGDHPGTAALTLPAMRQPLHKCQPVSLLIMCSAGYIAIVLRGQNKEQAVLAVVQKEGLTTGSVQRTLQVYKRGWFSFSLLYASAAWGAHPHATPAVHFPPF